jgi:predicted DNA-binding transcriptional regulator AlpA
MMTVREIQARLGIGRSAVYSLIHEQDFPTPVVINSRTLRWFSIDFEKWLEAKKTPLTPRKTRVIRNKSNLIIVNGVRFRKGKNEKH